MRYCANGNCETEAYYLTIDDTLLCHTCGSAYELGQGSIRALYPDRDVALVEITKRERPAFAYEFAPFTPPEEA